MRPWPLGHIPAEAKGIATDGSRWEHQAQGNCAPSPHFFLPPFLLLGTLMRPLHSSWGGNSARSPEFPSSPHHIPAV